MSDRGNVKERTVIKRAVPMRDLGLICSTAHNHDRGEIIAYFATHGRIPNMARKERAAKHDAHGHNGTTEALVEFRLRGDEKQEDVENQVAALLSAAKRMGLPWQEIAENAIGRMRR